MDTPSGEVKADDTENVNQNDRNETLNRNWSDVSDDHNEVIIRRPISRPNSASTTTEKSELVKQFSQPLALNAQNSHSSKSKLSQEN
jgi:hypothetical protein